MTPLPSPAKRIDSGVHFASPTVDIDDNPVGGNWDEHLPALTILTTCSGEALRNAPLAVSSPSWVDKHDEVGSIVPRKRTRAYEANVPGSTVMPALRKRGSVKRMVFQHRKGSDSPHDYPSPKCSVPQPSAETAQNFTQREIQRNYMEFLEGKFARASPHKRDLDCAQSENAEDEQQKAFESAFLEDSQTDGWATEVDSSIGELMD